MNTYRKPLLCVGAAGVLGGMWLFGIAYTRGFDAYATFYLLLIFLAAVILGSNWNDPADVRVWNRNAIFGMVLGLVGAIVIASIDYGLYKSFHIYGYYEDPVLSYIAFVLLGFMILFLLWLAFCSWRHRYTKNSPESC